MDKSRIAVLITCYNRKDTTLACIEAIKKQEAVDDVYLQIYLTDDGCTDGTGDAVRARFPDINVLQGGGNLYWGGGIRLAWSEAFKNDYDYYMWLNDDTLLHPGALRTMLDTSTRLLKEMGEEVIVSGSTCDPRTNKLTYGGVFRPNRRHAMLFALVAPTNQAKRCETINGNCVLIPRGVAGRVGNLSPDFSHGLGDFDYGLRAARDHGISSWISPGFIGTCSAHEIEGSHLDSSAPISERLEAMKRASGLPPAKEWMTFTRRHAGWLWPVYWLRTLTRICVPQLWLFLRGKPAGENMGHER
ncbi:MAG: glycosyltransferase family 2 protein [Proteobacteria bacterium]|nr:glycosyltransferase family 2 protein [Pseudomonadota bacterium]